MRVVSYIADSAVVSLELKLLFIDTLVGSVVTVPP